MKLDSIWSTKMGFWLWTCVPCLGKPWNEQLPMRRAENCLLELGLSRWTVQAQIADTDTKKLQWADSSSLTHPQQCCGGVVVVVVRARTNCRRRWSGLAGLLPQLLTITVIGNFICFCRLRDRGLEWDAHGNYILCSLLLSCMGYLFVPLFVCTIKPMCVWNRTVWFVGRGTTEPITSASLPTSVHRVTKLPNGLRSIKIHDDNATFQVWQPSTCHVPA